MAAIMKRERPDPGQSRIRIAPWAFVISAIAIGAIILIGGLWVLNPHVDGNDRDLAAELTIAWEPVWAEDTDVAVYDIEAFDGRLAMTASGFGSPRGMHAWFASAGDRWEPAQVVPPLAGDPNGTADFGPIFVAEERLSTIGFTQDRAGPRGRATLFASPDGGQSWEYQEHARMPTEAYVHDVIEFAGRYLAVGTSISLDDAVVWSSTDGETWEAEPGVIGAGPLHAIATDGGHLVAVGWEPSGANNFATFWSSEDGFAWSRSTVEVAASEAWDVVAVPGGFVAVGIAAERAVVWPSADGTAWRRVPGPTGSGRLFAITADERYVVAVGAGDGGPIVAASSSIDEWTFVTLRDEAPGHGPEAITADPEGEPGTFVTGGPANGGVFVARLHVSSARAP